MAAGDRFTYTLDKQLGTLSSAVLDGRELLRQPMALTAFRAATDNDARMAGRWYKRDIWMGENVDVPFTHVYAVAVGGNTARFTCSQAGVSRSPFFRYTLCVSAFADGTLRFSLDGQVKKECTWLPRLGFELALAKKNTAFEYFGKGPLENYCDSSHFATARLVPEHTGCGVCAVCAPAGAWQPYRCAGAAHGKFAGLPRGGADGVLCAAV